MSDSASDSIDRSDLPELLVVKRFVAIAAAALLLTVTVAPRTPAHFDPALMELLNQAIADDPNNATAYLQRGLAFNHLEEYDRAIADFSAAIRIDPTLVDAYNFRGTLLYRDGQLQQALADFNRALELAPEFAVAYFNRGYVRRDLGDIPGAIADFERGADLSEQQGDLATATQARAILSELRAP